jgi:cytochrome c
VTARVRSATAILAAACAAAGCERASQRLADLTGGDPKRGKIAIRTYGCGSCHTIPGVRGASGQVGPPLTGIAQRVYVGGVITNTPENLVRWIQNAPSIDPMTAMPNVGVTHQDAVDIAGYLYSRR